LEAGETELLHQQVAADQMELQVLSLELYLLLAVAAVAGELVALEVQVVVAMVLESLGHREDMALLEELELLDKEAMAELLFIRIRHMVLTLALQSTYGRLVEVAVERAELAVELQ